MAPRLHLVSFGPPLLLSEAGEQVRLPTRKHFALLIRLAVEAGRSFTRDYLMDLLWTDVALGRASHSLAQALTVLKGKVGPEHFVLQDRQTITLAADAVDADVGRLDAGDVEIGGPFLDGFEVRGAVQFGHWKDEWRGKLMPRMRDCLVRQMDEARRIGDFTTVERRASVLLELDPLSEDAVRGVMEARAWVGDRTNALAAYGGLATRLAEELGGEPSADLARIAELFREGRRPAGRQAAEGGRVAERLERRFDPETLIGREREFACLYDAWLEVRGGVPRIAVLIGDSGVGKTTLTNAFVSACQMEGAIVARAQAYDAERELPFAVLAELIKQLALQRAIGAADPEALGELARISPEILAAFPGVPKPIDWSAEVIPLRLADSFLKAVLAATEESPLVLVVDDIHAADNASAAILHVTARKLPPARLLLILTARSNELRAAMASSAIVTDPTIRAIETLELEPLQATAAERLVAAVVAKSGRPLSDVPVPRLLQACNGNPLALELLTKEWLAHGSSSLLADLEALNTQPVANLGIPRAIATVFERQIHRLEPPLRSALDLAAVLGRRLADLPMYELIGLSPAAAGEALSRLKDGGFLREVHGGLEFRNELIRAHAYYAVAGPARQHLHRRIGERLAERKLQDGQAPSLEIAWHFLRGGDASNATQMALEGAEAAISVGAPLEAEEILTALLRRPGADKAVGQVRLLLARALLQQSKGEAARPVLDLLSQDASLSVRDIADIERMQATVEYLLNQESGLHYAEAADRALRAAQHTLDIDLIGKALFEYARSGANAGDQDRVASAREQTRLILAQSQSRKPAILFYTKAYCDFFSYELRSAAAELERTIALLDERSEPAELSFAYSGYGTCKHGLCEFEAACDVYAKALELSRRIGDDPRSSTIASNICAVRLHQGHYSSAVDFGDLAVRLGTRSLSPRLVAVHLNLAVSLLMSGRRDAAQQSIDAAQQASATERSWVATIEFLLGFASISLATGNTTLALELIEVAERLAWGKERAVSNAGLFDKLRIFRAAHVSGPAVARALALECKEKYRDRHPFYYLDAIACTAWLEKRSLGHYTEESHLELRLFDLVGATGLRSILIAQGFLS